jgi:hypothetical protein
VYALCSFETVTVRSLFQLIGRAWYVTEQNWNGFGHVLEGPFSLHWASKPLAMHVDEDAGTILTLHEESVIILSSLESGEIVEKLDEVRHPSFVIAMFLMRRDPPSPQDVSLSRPQGCRKEQSCSIAGPMTEKSALS